jgi:hypothetical protein
LRLKCRIKIIDFWKWLIHSWTKMRLHFSHLVLAFNVIKFINLFKHFGLLLLFFR